MSNMESEIMQFDDTDLIYGQPTSIQVPHQKPVESITNFLQEIIQKDSIPKEELRERWNTMKSEREKMLKQRNKSKEQIAYWISTNKELEYQLNRNIEELNRLRPKMIADCLREEIMESENIQVNDTDLIFGKPTTIQVPHLKPVEPITTFLQKIIQKDSIPKEELRKRWNNIKSEQEKMLKQRNKSKEKIAYWISTNKELEYQLNRNAEELNRLHGRMIADCLSED